MALQDGSAVIDLTLDAYTAARCDARLPARGAFT